jgi:large subunit ribosomal protein L17
MRHARADVKLGRETNHRRSLLRNLVTSLLREERLVTTVQKARFMRPHAEKMITLGKRGGLHARRQAAAFLVDPDTVRKLFDTVGPRFSARPGGYTRMIRKNWRQGDGAEMAMVELVGSVLKKREKKKDGTAMEKEEEQTAADNKTKTETKAEKKTKVKAEK